MREFLLVYPVTQNRNGRGLQIRRDGLVGDPQNPEESHVLCAAEGIADTFPDLIQAQF